MYNQQRAEDVYRYHCFMYYVLHQPRMPDWEFDLMHKYFLGLYPHSVVLNTVQSDNQNDYPLHIREFRRPRPSERISYPPPPPAVQS